MSQAGYLMDTEDNLIHVTCLPDAPACRHLVQETLEIIGNKWAVPIMLTLLAQSPLRNSQIKRSVQGINAKELAKQLRLLEAAGLIGREVYPSVPPRVEYWITDLGWSLHPVLDGLGTWAATYGSQVEKNRQLFDTPAALEPTANTTIHRIRK